MARLKWMLMLAVLLSLGSAAHAQDDDSGGDGEEAMSAETRVDRQVYRRRASYYSDKLGANFIAEWMYIRQNGRRVTFWGARIVGIDDDSPLHDLGVSFGDVITRLDGVRINTGMYRTRDRQGNVYWALPELDEHYGRTEFRYIRTGTNEVLIDTIRLGGGGGGGGGGGNQPIAP